MEITDIHVIYCRPYRLEYYQAILMPFFQKIKAVLKYASLYVGAK